jgi:hypothetical protein
MNSANKTWPISTAAKAADMQSRALRQWFSTRVLKLRANDRKSTGSGDHCGLSRQRAYQAAITQTLNRYGVSVSRAALAAALFTDEGQPNPRPQDYDARALSNVTIVQAARSLKLLRKLEPTRALT